MALTFHRLGAKLYSQPYSHGKRVYPLPRGINSNWNWFRNLESVPGISSEIQICLKIPPMVSTADQPARDHVGSTSPLRPQALSDNDPYKSQGICSPHLQYCVYVKSLVAEMGLTCCKVWQRWSTAPQPWPVSASGDEASSTLNQRLYRKDRLPRAYFCYRQLAKFGIVWGIFLYNALLGPVCYKLTDSCFPCCGVLGFCRFWFKIQDIMGWN